MAYGGEHLLIQFSGGLPSGEVWSCGLRTTSPLTPGAGDNIAAIASGCVTPWTTFFTTSNVAAGANTTFTTVTARVISPAGVTTAIGVASPGSAVVGLGANALPNQIARCFTLQTGRAGRSGRGRIYVPALGAVLGSTGLISSTFSLNCAQALATAIISMNSAIQAQTNVAVFIGVQSQVILDNGARVLSVRVGNVLDTQRRRRDAMTEAYSSATVTP